MSFLRNPSRSSSICCFLCFQWVYVHLNTFQKCFEYETVQKGDSNHMQPEDYVIHMKFLMIPI